MISEKQIFFLKVFGTSLYITFIIFFLAYFFPNKVMFGGNVSPNKCWQKVILSFPTGGKLGTGNGVSFMRILSISATNHFICIALWSYSFLLLPRWWSQRCKGLEKTAKYWWKRPVAGLLFDDLLHFWCWTVGGSLTRFWRLAWRWHAWFEGWSHLRWSRTPTRWSSRSSPTSPSADPALPSSGSRPSNHQLGISSSLPTTRATIRTGISRQEYFHLWIFKFFQQLGHHSANHCGFAVKNCPDLPWSRRGGREGLSLRLGGYQGCGFWEVPSGKVFCTFSLSLQVVAWCLGLAGIGRLLPWWATPTELSLCFTQTS